MFSLLEPDQRNFYEFSSILSFRGVHGHFYGKRPWALGDECIVELMADIVGKKSWKYFFGSAVAFLHHVT